MVGLPPVSVTVRWWVPALTRRVVAGEPSMADVVVPVPVPLMVMVVGVAQWMVSPVVRGVVWWRGGAGRGGAGG